MLKILDNINAPDNAFELVLNGPNMPKQRGTLSCQWAIAIKKCGCSLQVCDKCTAAVLFAVVTGVEVPHGPPGDVIAYEFAPQLLNILQNPSIMTSENLFIDLENPLQSYQSPFGRLGDALSWSVYRDAHRTAQTFTPGYGNSV